MQRDGGRDACKLNTGFPEEVALRTGAISKLSNGLSQKGLGREEKDQNGAEVMTQHASALRVSELRAPLIKGSVNQLDFVLIQL
jgi:hypothetical protein